MRRTFTAEEIAKILHSQNVLEFDLADELQAVQMGRGDGLIWTIVSKAERSNRKFLDKAGNPKFLDELDITELAEISQILWEKISPQFLNSQEILDEILTPDALKDPPPDLAEGLAALVPDALRPKPDDPNLEPDPTELTPDALREKKDSAKPTLEDQLTPNHLRDPGVMFSRGKTRNYRIRQKA